MTILDDDRSMIETGYLRDMADIIKNRTMFFIPFFGAYLAFMFANVEYIKGSNPLIWLICVTLFAASARYIQLVTQLLWAIESCRMIFGFINVGISPWKDREKESKSVTEVMALIPKMAEAESWWFSRILTLFYFATFNVLADIFFGSFIREQVARLVSKLIH